MGWLGRIFGSRRRREDRLAVEARLRGVLEDDGPAAAWTGIAAALEADPEHDALFHLAAEVLRRGGDARTAELFDRAADAPHDPQRLFELGSTLLGEEQPEVAATLLERALRFVPFDAVVRSELALARARSGRPDKVLEALALHPCLADDAGALFEFGWASLLTGDLDAAEGALGELHGAPSLRRKLAQAIERARIGMAADPPDARDYYFVEHGGLVIDAGGPSAGRFPSLSIDRAWMDAWLGALGWLLRAQVPKPRHVIAIDDAHAALAEAVARACDGVVRRPERGGLPRGIVPVRDGDVLAAVDPSDELLVVAATLDPWRTAPRAPDVVGALARDATWTPDTLAAADGAGPPDASLRSFVEPRRHLLPPNGKRVVSAYVPDAPLPR